MDVSPIERLLKYVMVPKPHRGGFPVHVCHFVCNYTHNSKTKHRVRMFTYRMIALLSEISILVVRAVCEMRLVSYGCKHALQLLCDTSFYVYSHS